MVTRFVQTMLGGQN